MAEPVFIHPQGIVEAGAQIGAGSRVWAFAHILGGARLGADCNVCDHVFIENDVRIGDRVTVKNGVQLWDGTTLEDDVFIGPNASFANDDFPRSKRHPSGIPGTLLRRGASIGANANILPGVIIGQHAMIGAGAVVTHDVPPHAIVKGNPGRVTGFVDAGGAQPLVPLREAGAALTVRAARLVALASHIQPRGILSVAEVQRDLPFVPQRLFIVYSVPPHELRGGHAHRSQHQFLICTHGSCHVVLDDGRQRDEVALDTPSTGLHVPPVIWGIQYKYSPDCVLLVLNSGRYDTGDYLSDYDEFLALTRGAPR